MKTRDVVELKQDDLKGFGYTLRLAECMIWTL